MPTNRPMHRSLSRSFPSTPFGPWCLTILLSIQALHFGCGASDETSEGSARAKHLSADFVLVTIDTLRHDSVGFAGLEDVETPHLDRLASRGLVFEQARSPAVVTLPAHASLLTGLDPYQHGLRDNGGYVLDAGVETLATTLRAAGYATGAFVAAYPLDPAKGLDAGFDIYEAPTFAPGDEERLLLGFPDPRSGQGERPGAEVVADAVEWWQANEGRSRFLWVHVYEPHAPYLPPEPYAGRYADDPYLGEVAWTDALLAPLFDLLPTGSGGPLVVVTSDHGEGLGDHDEPTHGFFAYEATIRVPLVLAGAGIEPGRRSDPVSLVDVLPTALRRLGVEPNGYDGPGRDLLAEARETDESRNTYFESMSPHLSFGWAALRGVVAEGWKYIDQPRPELYDLASDPGEQTNLAASEPTCVARLRGLLPRADDVAASRTLDADERARLLALGYLSDESNDPSGPVEGEGVDLKDTISSYNALREAVGLLQSGRADEAVRAARAVLDEMPSLGFGHSVLATALLRQGRPTEAIEAMRAAVDIGAADAELRRQLASTLVDTGDPLGALPLLEELAAEPERRSPAVLNLLGIAQMSAGRTEAARATFEQAIDSFPEEVRSYENLSFVLLESGDVADAESAARKALALRSDLPGVWNNLGLALYEQDRADEALDAWESALAFDPDHRDVLFNAGLVAMERGRTDLAESSLRHFLQLAAGSREELAQLARTDPRVRAALGALGELAGPG